MLFMAELNFVVPPKSNRYLTGRNGKRFLPQRIRQAIDDAVLILSSLKKETIDCPCQLYVRYTFPDRRKRDVDNMNKTLQDCLQKAKVIKDDFLFYRTISEKRYKKGKESTEIFIFELSEPMILSPMEFYDDKVKRENKRKLRNR